MNVKHQIRKICKEIWDVDIHFDMDYTLFYRNKLTEYYTSMNSVTKKMKKLNLQEVKQRELEIFKAFTDLCER